jgi:hypothetical protein
MLWLGLDEASEQLQDRKETSEINWSKFAELQLQHIDCKKTKVFDLGIGSFFVQ